MLEFPQVDQFGVLLEDPEEEEEKEAVRRRVKTWEGRGRVRK